MLWIKEARTIDQIRIWRRENQCNVVNRADNFSSVYTGIKANTVIRIVVGDTTSSIQTMSSIDEVVDMLRFAK